MSRNRRTPDSLPPFERIVAEHGPGLLRFCVSRAGGGGEDVFQETMIAALRAYPELREPEAAGSWLFAIAARKVIDAGRSAARAPRPIGDPGAAIDAASPPLPPPEYDREVWTAVAALPPKQREAVGLRFIADLSHAEIGEAMGTSAEAARRNVFEGLRRLRVDGVGGVDGVGDLTEPAGGTSHD